MLQILVSSPQSVGNPLVFAWGLKMLPEAQMNLRKSKTAYPVLHNQAGKTCFTLERQPAISQGSGGGLGCSFGSGPA